jgi:peptidoglycan hydrolase-like protein with peptidoglycan-binding domain
VISESPFNEMFQTITRSRNLVFAYKTLFKIKISNIIREIKDVSLFVRFLVGLFKIGFITIKFLTKLGLMVGGVFISWHLIAQKLGIMPKKQVTKNEQIKLDNKTKDFVIEYLTKQKDGNEIFSIKRNSSVFRLAVLLIQYCLKAGGYDVTNQDRVEMTPEWEKKTPQGQVNFNYDPKYDYLYTSKGKNELNKKRQDWSRSKNTPLTKNSTKVKLNFKWGYFDENTDKMIKSFQKDHNLTPNGLVGKQTITAILSDLENGKMDTIKNFSGHKLTNKEEEYLYTKDVEKQQIELQKIELSKLQEEYNKQKNESIKNIKRMSENVDFVNQFSAEEWDKKMKELETLEESVIK